MLAINDVSIQLGPDVGAKLLAGVSAMFPLAHFGAIIGPSGCGKTSLLKLIAGIAPGREQGEVVWNGRNLADDDFRAGEIAYVPQFGIAHEELTARECVEYALALRVRATSRDHAQKTVHRVLAEVGMQDFAEQAVKTLSGGQRR
ncbi:MAG TPA: ABC transporter ATP-binding protein, partial [Chthoniobacteraceae bacterium]